MTGGNGVGKIPYFTCPSKGDMRFPVIIVKYQDIGLSDTDENVVRHFYEFFNKEGYDYAGATGSVRDYFVCASAGRFRPQFDVYGPVLLKNDRTYYGDGIGTSAGHPDEMVTEAVTALQGKVDFTRYDSNGDGHVDDVIIVYAGYSERFGAPDSAVLPTSFLISFNKYGVPGFEEGFEVNGICFNSYTVTNEMAYDGYDGIGTFLHEFSHALGLGDLYNVLDPSSEYTPKYDDLMDVGLYNNRSNTPPTYSAFERYCLGWIDLEVIDKPRKLRLESLEKTGKAFIVPVTDNEFYIIENRQPDVWDKFKPYHGMQIWHIDYNRKTWYDNAANQDKDHQRAMLIKPNGDVALPTFCGKDLGLIIRRLKDKDGVVRFAVAKKKAAL